MKYISILAFLVLSACAGMAYDQGKCGDGYVEDHRGKCINPGMRLGDGMAEGIAIVGTLGVLTATGVIVP